MAIVFNSTNISTSSNIVINNQSVNKVMYNNLVWNKSFQAYPGRTWEHYVNQSDGGGGYGAISEIRGNNLYLNAGYNGSSAQCGLFVDFTPWKTLTVHINSGSCSYGKFRFGAMTTWTNVYSNNVIKSSGQENFASYNPVGTHTLDVSDVNGAYYIIVYLYAGSTREESSLTIDSVTLS